MSFHRNDPADLLALKNEVTLDPNGYGYNQGDTEGTLSILNLKRPEITVSKPKISSADIRSKCTYDAYNNLSIDEQEWIRWMTGSNGFEEENVVVTADLRTQLTDGSNSIWAPSDRPAMTTAMLDIIDVEGSRAEQLFGYGVVITRNDWLAARDS